MNFKKLAVVALGMGAVASSFATGSGVDVTSTVTSITDQLAPIGLIGGAVLGVFVALKGYKWVRRAL
jgi:hypothetical protein